AFRRVERSTTFHKTALVLGTGDLSHACADLLHDDNDLGMGFAGILARPEEATQSPRVIGHYGDLARLVDERHVGLIVVAYSDRRGTFPANELLELKFQGVDIEEGVDFYERMTGKLFVRDLKPSQLIFSHGFHVRRRTLILKRALDVACATIG